MGRLASKLVRKMYRDSGGYIPNVGNIAIRPGSILTRVNGIYELSDSLARRAAAGGASAEEVDALERAMEAADPVQGSSSGMHQLGLKYKSGSTLSIAAEVPFDVTIPMQSGPIVVSANVVVEFGNARDYVFNTTKPVPWYTFTDKHVDAVRTAAAKYLERGEFVAVGVAKAQNWVWHISRASKTSIAFTATGSAGLGGLGVDDLAEISASPDFSMAVDNSSMVSGDGVNSVAAFRVLKKRDKRAADGQMGFSSTRRSDGLAEPTDSDLLDLTSMTRDEDD